MLNQGSFRRRLQTAFRVLTVLGQRPHLARLFGMEGPHDPQLAEGWALYHRAMAADQHRTVKHALTITAALRCANAFHGARAAQARLTALARVLFTSASERQRLGLNGRRAEAVGAWRLQAEVFHANLTDEDRARLRRVGVDAAELAHAESLLAQLALEHPACIAAKAEATAATQAKARAFRDLANFLSLIITIARVLEPQHPHLIELLGMSPDGRRRRPASTTDATRSPSPSTQPEDLGLPEPLGDSGPEDPVIEALGHGLEAEIGTDLVLKDGDEIRERRRDRNRRKRLEQARRRKRDRRRMPPPVSPTAR